MLESDLSSPLPAMQEDLLRNERRWLTSLIEELDRGKKDRETLVAAVELWRAKGRFPSDAALAAARVDAEIAAMRQEFLAGARDQFRRRSADPLDAATVDAMAETLWDATLREGEPRWLLDGADQANEEISCWEGA